MGRRIKEPPEIHRDRIADAAEALFSQKGIEASTVDEIARNAGYGKATLYAYFKNKEDIVGFLVLKSMTLLRDRLHRALQRETLGTTRARYDALCIELTRFQEEYPLYFSIALEEINVDFEHPDALDVERDIYDVGEQINEEIGSFIEQGMASRELRADLPLPHTIYLFWAALSGFIVMASKKERYFTQNTGMSKESFLEEGFETLYRSVQA